MFAGLLISERNDRKDENDRYVPELRLVYAPRGETSGYLKFPLRDLAMVAGRPMLGIRRRPDFHLKRCQLLQSSRVQPRRGRVPRRH